MSEVSQEQIHQYLSSLYASDPDLERISRKIRDNNMPEISIHPMYGRLLTMLVTIIGAEKALEIGALGGYSGLCIARGLRNNGSAGRLISLELDPKFADVA